MVTITYNWKHVGHNPGSLDDVRSGPAQRMISDAIQEQVDRNLTWFNIKNMLRLDKNVLASIISNENIESIPLALGVKYNDVYYAIKKSMERKALLHKDMVESLKLWEKKIIENEICRGFFYFRNLDSIEVGMFFIAFMSEQQLKVY
jgi:hypothetical protein